MRLRRQRRRRLASLHDLAAAQNCDAVGHLGDHREIVRDEQQAHAVLVDEIAQEFEDLGLQHDVERCRRLVGDEQLGFERTGDGDDDALPLAARQLVRIAGEGKLFRRQPDPVEHLSRLRLGVGTVRAGVPAYALGDLLADRLQRVERRHRLLEDHADVVATKRAHLVLGGGQYIDAVETDAARCPGGLRQKPHDRQRRHRLAGAGFADQTHHFAGLDRKLDILEDRGTADIERQVFDLEQAHR